MLRGATQLADEHLGPKWPLQVCLALGSAEEKQQRLKLHHHAKLVAAVVCDDTHWGLLMLQRGRAQCWLYDGLQKPTIVKEAQRFLRLAGQAHHADYELCVAEVAHQDDTWSCGHRLLCTLDAILAAWKKKELEWPPRLALDVHSDEALQAMCTEEEAAPAPSTPAAIQLYSLRRAMVSQPMTTLARWFP